MQPQPYTLAETINTAQLLAGLIILAVLLSTFWRSGQLRRAFAFPPPPQNALTGTHLLVILAAFFAVSLLASLALQMLGVSPPPATPPAGISATQTAPAETQSAVEQATSPSATQPNAFQPAPASAPADSQPADTPRKALASLAVQTAGELILLAVLLHLAHRTFAGGLAGFGLRTDRLGRDLFWAIVAYLAFWPICAGIAEATVRLLHVLAPTWEPPEHPVLQSLQQPGLPFFWHALLWTLAGGIAPFFEDVLFRGLLLSWLRTITRSTWLAIALTAIAFGLIHDPQWQFVPALTALGFVLGYLYARTGSLTLVILFHMIFNLRTLIFTAVSGETSP